MKKVLVIGQKGYIASSLKNWLEQDKECEVHAIGVRDDRWKENDFSCYDSICFAVGLAHIKETEENAKDYYRINKEIAVEVARKARKEGVAQFVYLSSTSVYSSQGEININTSLTPNTHYGKSKLEAEAVLRGMATDTFKVAVVRPPIVYGKGCPGNYVTLRKIALATLLFPKINNTRSMIYIDNLCEFIRNLIKRQDEGVFHPQNEEYVNTSEMVCLIAKAHGKKIQLVKVLNLLVFLTRNIPGKVGRMSSKAFGSQYYSKALSEYPVNYNVCKFEETIYKTER